MVTTINTSSPIGILGNLSNTVHLTRAGLKYPTVYRQICWRNHRIPKRRAAGGSYNSNVIHALTVNLIYREHNNIHWPVISFSNSSAFSLSGMAYMADNVLCTRRDPAIDICWPKQKAIISYFFGFWFTCIPAPPVTDCYRARGPMMVGDPCPMHKQFHTMMGLMEHGLLSAPDQNWKRIVFRFSGWLRRIMV